MSSERVLLIQQASGPYTQLLDLSASRHAAYAARHGLQLWSVKGDVQWDRPPHWNKIPLIRTALSWDFELVVWLDADTLIVRDDVDIRTALPPGPPIGLCHQPIPWNGQPYHHNTGVIVARNTTLVRRFFREVWKSPPLDHPWQEQVRIMEAMEKWPRAVQRLDDQWNSSEGLTPHPNPVIRAWHGFKLGALTPMYEALKAMGALDRPPDQYRFLHVDNALTRAEQFITTIPPYPGHFSGRGIVICGGGERYFPCAWTGIRQLRRLGCKLPIQLWHLGREELDDRMADLMGSLGVTCIDAQALRERFPARILNGWEVKPYSLLHCPFREVLLLDADNLAVVNPEFLFDTPEFKQTGAIFWPDQGRLAADSAIWRICGVPYRNEPEMESGQVVLDKQRCWRALSLCMWYNEHSDFFYRHIYGDKETFHLAWRKLKRPYAIAPPVHFIEDTFCHHDFNGRRIFQHRVWDKWRLDGRNKRIHDFWFEAECRADLKALRRRWDGRIHPPV